MSAPLRVGLAGAGMISFHHLVAWSRVAGAKVTAICDVDRARAAARAREFGVEAVFDDAAAMLATGGVDALDVATPADTHAALVTLAVARGLPVLCQKPLTPDLASAEALVAATRGRARLMVHENWRFRPYYRQVRRWLDAGRVGAVRQASLVTSASGLLPGPDGKRPGLIREPGLVALPRLMISNLLIHHLDVARWLVGPLQVIAAIAGRDVDVVRAETRATVLLAAAGGVPVLVGGNFCVPGAPPRPLDRLEIVGSEATVLLEGSRLALLGATPEILEFDLDVAYQESFDATIRHFVERVADGGAFETDGDDNLATLRLVEDAYRLAT